VYFQLNDTTNVKGIIMMQSTISSAVLSALLFTSATLASASAAPLTDAVDNDNRLVEHVSVAALAADIESSTNATGAKKTITTSQFSFTQPQGDDANTFVFSSVLADAFYATGQAGITGHGGSVKSIKNAPYRAEVVNEAVQILNDGNQIIKRNTQMTYRDSAGRTRMELTDNDGAIRSIAIHDAVEKTSYHLIPKNKTATKISIDPNFHKRIGELREKAKEISRDGKSTLITRSPGEEMVISRVERPRGTGSTGSAGAAEEVRINVIRTSDDEKVSVVKLGERLGELGAMRIDSSAMSGLSGLNQNLAGLGALSTTFADRAWAAKATTKELGTKDIDGIRAEGKLRAYTIPAGELGNKNPITVSTETWVSPELQITLYSKHSDPRTGDKIYRLQNIKRSEQSLDLFNVPDGYQVKDMPAMKFEVKGK
jgi:predicted outer membrane protein